MGVRVREWKGAWWVFVAHRGQRKAKRIGVGAAGKQAAHRAAQQIAARLALGQGAFPAEPASPTLAEYATAWLEHIRQVRKPNTARDYAKRLGQWILPALGALPLRSITRDKVRAFVTEQLTRGLAPKTVANTVRVLSSVLSQALEDGLVSTNVALKPGRFLPGISKRRKVNPLTREEVSAFLRTIQRHAPRYYPLFLCAVRTGLRLGELLALQWGDLDLRSRYLLVQRSWSHGHLTTPKSGEVRRVDLSQALTRTLKDLYTERELEAAATGAAMSPWVFCSETGGLLDPDNLRHRVFYPALRAAGLRQIRIHDLRHTFASLLLQQGESPVYVKEQMGHSSIQVTVDLYGHLIPGGNRQAVDRLDDPLAEAESATSLQPAGAARRGGDAEVLETLWCARPDSNGRPAGSKPDALSN